MDFNLEAVVAENERVASAETEGGMCWAMPI